MLFSDYHIARIAALQGASIAPARSRGFCIVRLFDEQLNVVYLEFSYRQAPP